MLKRLLMVLLLLGLPGLVQAGVSNTVVIDQSNARLIAGGYDSQGKLLLGLHFEIDKGWKMYWRDPGDTGFEPRLDWQGSVNVGQPVLRWPAPLRHIDRFGEVTSESYTYQDEVVFPIVLEPEQLSQPVEIALNVSYGICEKICIPAEAKLALSVVPGYVNDAHMQAIAAFEATVPKANGSHGMAIEAVTYSRSDAYDNALVIVAKGQQPFSKQVDVFVEAGGKAAFYSPMRELSADQRQAVFTAPITYLNRDNDLGQEELVITLVDGKQAVQHIVAASAIERQEVAADSLLVGQEAASSVPHVVPLSLWLVLVFGLLGGLILNVMPCVLPVLSIKLLGVINHGGADHKAVSLKFLVAGSGIVVSFVALAGLLIVLRGAGMNVGWGFHFQEPFFIIALVLILTLFAANLWGFFEISLPGRWQTSASEQCHRKGLMGHFMSGVLATVLATPCTAPFLGTAVGFAVSQGAGVIVAVFAAMGLGMALPYLVFALVPGLVTKMPKPGAWMVRVKYVMGWLLIATALWLIWVVSNQLGVVAAVVLLALCVLKLIKLALGRHVAFLARPGVRVGGVLVMMALAFLLPNWVKDQAPASRAQQQSLWQPFDQAAIVPLVKAGKVVFVDVTADWCLTCKVNKALVLDRGDVVQSLAADDVVTMVADWTNKNEAIAAYLQTHQRIGIPFNIAYGPGAPDGVVLSELLSKREVLAALKKARGG